MQSLVIIVLSLLLLVVAPLSYAGANDEPTTKSQGVENMSDEGAANSNSPATGDQLKGEDRADERHSLDQPGTDTDTSDTTIKKNTKDTKKTK